LCFEKRRPKQKYNFSPKVKRFVPQIFGHYNIFGLATPLVQCCLCAVPAHLKNTCPGMCCDKVSLYPCVLPRR